MQREDVPPPGMRQGADYAENMRAMRDRVEALGRILDKVELGYPGPNELGIPLSDIGFAREIQHYLDFVSRTQLLPVPAERLATLNPKGN